MIGEAMLAIKALDSAFVMVQGAIAKKKEVQDNLEVLAEDIKLVVKEVLGINLEIKNIHV